jgi:hypothetical protein
VLDRLPARLDSSPGAGREEEPHGDVNPGASAFGQPNVWKEDQQGFAPYGQLFSRLRQIRDANESS